MITGNELAMPTIKTNGKDWTLNGKTHVYGDTFSTGGLTIRHYFAAMAMQGILANSEFLANHKDIDIHTLSVSNADHLIAELNKEKI